MQRLAELMIGNVRAWGPGRRSGLGVIELPVGLLLRVFRVVGEVDSALVSTRCSRQRAARICPSVQYRHRKENRRQGQPLQYPANPANRGHRWYSCGALIRDDKCVLATCGKST